MTGSAEYKIHVAGGQGGNIVLTPGDPNALTDLADETVGTEITPVEIQASGGTAPYSFSVSSGALPDGVQAVSDGVDTLQLSGTPTVAGDFDFVISATDANGAAAKTTRFAKRVA